MKFLLLCFVVAGVSASGEDWKMFMNWAKTKAMEACWGEENMKLHTLNMKKAVAKCMQTDAPELELPPFRAMNRLVTSMVSMAGETGQEPERMEMRLRFLMMLKMMKHGMEESHGSHGSHGGYHSQRHGCNGYHDCKEKYGMGYMMRNKEDSMMDKMKSMMMMKMMGTMEEDDSSEESWGHDNMDMGDMFEKMYKMKSMSSSRRNYDGFDFKKMMERMRFKRDANDALALNDRLKEKLEDAMEKHMNKVTNMTCVLREMHCIDEDNNIDIKAMKEDAENYKMPSEWFKEHYFTILDSCYEVSENLPADLDNMYNVGTNDKSPLKNMGKIKSFMDCCKSAKRKLCINQDTKAKIETNFGPVDELLEGFNNQINEEQLFYMVNQLLQGSEEEFM